MMIQFGRPPTVDRYSLCTNEEISSSSQPASPSTADSHFRLVQCARIEFNKVFFFIVSTHFRMVRLASFSRCSILVFLYFAGYFLSFFAFYFQTTDRFYKTTFFVNVTCFKQHAIVNRKDHVSFLGTIYSRHYGKLFQGIDPPEAFLTKI